ncbi:hypothetical protein JXC34_06325 [Candidatus Woesearchaeota archaeon]|nr:hypothetical protein [Candidatus Woesearchaeota archaeon]
MAKSQVISMDFIMAFVIYLFALSFFFFSMQGILATGASASLDVPSELMFGKLEIVENEDYDFLDSSKVDDAKLTKFMEDFNPRKTYDFFFVDFEDFRQFTRIDYCVYLERINENSTDILRNVAASKDHPSQDYSIMVTPEFKCGQQEKMLYQGIANKEYPRCSPSSKSESVVLTKPVLYKGEIVNLKVLICAEKR